MKTFEHRVLDVTTVINTEIEKKLNELGAQGWELVATTTLQGNQRTLYLKREKQKGYSFTYVDNGALVEKWVGHGPNVDVYIEEQVDG